MSVKFNKRIWPNIVNAAKDSINDSVELIYKDIVYLVKDTPKTGRIYVRPNGVHQASAPGEPFANDTGNALLNTKKYKENGGLRGRVAGEAEYARSLELGTSKMQPRPVFRPAVARKSKDIVATFEQKILSAIKK